jgi:ribosomal protein S27E
LDFYLLTKTDADQLDAELNTIADMAKASRTNGTGFNYEKMDLDSGLYTVVIVNANNETADISYTIHRTTSAELTSTLVLFFFVFVAMAAGWMQYTRKLASSPEMPAALPPALVQTAPAPERPTVQRAPIGGATASGLESTPAPSSMAAISEPPAGGTRMTITCPRCSTTFDVVRGGGPTRIKCPSCGKEGTLAGLPMPPREPEPEAPPAASPAAVEAPCIPRVERPAPYPPSAPAREEYLPPEPAYPAAPRAPAYPSEPTAPATAARPPVETHAEIPEAPAIPAEPVLPVTPVPRRNIACPRCRQIFSIDKVEGPQQIRCPHCGKEGTIGARRQPVPAAAPPAPRPAPPPIPEAPVTHVPVSPAAAPKMICCPACKRPFPVAETRRPLQVKCPNCGKEGVLRK